LVEIRLDIGAALEVEEGAVERKGEFKLFVDIAPEGGKLIAWFPMLWVYRIGGADFVATIGRPDETIFG
jgi:hypothetical protein